MENFSFENLNKSRKENILKSFSNIYETPQSDIDQEISKAIELDVIEKGGKRATLGEIREWSGKKYQKTSQGWKPYGGKGLSHGDVDVTGQKDTPIPKEDKKNIDVEKIKKEYDELTDENDHGAAAMLLVDSFGTDEEKEKLKDINDSHNKRGDITESELKERRDITQKYYNKFIANKKEEPKKDNKRTEGVFERGDEIEVGKYKMSVVGYNEDGQLKVMNQQNEKFTLSKEKTKELEAKQYPKEDSKPKEEKKTVIKDGDKAAKGSDMIYDKLKKVDNSKFENGFGFVTNVGGKKIGFLSYNSGGQKNLSQKESLNLSSLKKLEGIVDNSIILNLQAHYNDKASKITKMELSSNDIDMVIVTDHNVSSPEVFKQPKKDDKKEDIKD